MIQGFEKSFKGLKIRSRVSVLAPPPTGCSPSPAIAAPPVYAGATLCKASGSHFGADIRLET
jgi:hypothetical protein